MDNPNSPQAVEYYASIWINLVFGLLCLAIGGLGVYGTSLILPGILQPGNYSLDFAVAVLAVPAITVFFLYGGFSQLRRALVPKPEFRLDSRGITAYARSGESEFFPWRDTGPTGIEWQTAGKSPSRHLKLELKGGKERFFPDLLLAVSLEELQEKIGDFQKAYGTCPTGALHGPDEQRAQRIGLAGWVIGIMDVIATFWR